MNIRNILREVDVLTRYNGFRGSICITGMNSHPRLSNVRGLCEAKPDERLSNISHTIQDMCFVMCHLMKR